MTARARSRPRNAGADLARSILAEALLTSIMAERLCLSTGKG